MDDLREVIARGLRESDPEGCDGDWSYEPQAEKLLAFFKQAGFVVAPAEPTGQMLEAGADADIPGGRFGEDTFTEAYIGAVDAQVIWKAMIEASNAPT